MMSKKILIPVAAVLVLAGVAAALLFAQANASAQPSLLFVYGGPNAEIIQTDDNDTQFELVVPIESEESLVTWFTDRPDRDAGTLTYKAFLDFFTESGSDSFKNDPPNVAISYNGNTVIAVMTEPEITTSNDNSLAFRATFTLIDNPQDENSDASKGFIAGHVERSGDNQLTDIEKLDHVTVFVDNLTCWVSWGYSVPSSEAGQPGVSCTDLTLDDLKP
jgi:hypothetical protein